MLAGAAYAATNTLFDMWDRSKPLVSTLASVHGFIDRGVPLFAGALMGLAVHYWALRTELAKREASRAEDLGARLQKVERDQAVWIVATSTLHEVRNPLHSLGLLIDEVVALDEAGDSATRRDLLQRARAQMARIEESIGALRHLATSAKPSVREVDLAALAEQVADSAKPHRSEDHAIALDVVCRARPLVRGDAAFLRIIVENLVQNSLEALASTERDDGRILVETVTSGDEAIVRIADNGPGIPADKRAEVFEPLATTKTQGMGLGLAISRALARAMKGDVTFVERDDWSSCIELRMPVRA